MPTKNTATSLNSGEVTLEDRIAAKDYCIDICANKKISKFLVDSSKSEMDIDAIDFTKFAYSFSRSDFPENIKFSLIFGPGSSFANFAKNIIAAKGIHNKAFLDETEALKWLLAE